MDPLTFAGPDTVNTVGDPAEPPLASRRSRLSAPVGSLVLIREFTSLESRKNSANSSGDEPGPGPFVVASSTKEMEVPKVKPVEYSLKKLEIGLSISVTVPGRVPVTRPVLDVVPSVPSVMKSEMVIVFDDGPPPLVKSRIRYPLSVERPAVLIVTS
jgi:hypothetical protein